MLVTGKSNKKKIFKSGFSLVEIIISLAIFSFIITVVITVAISMVRAQQKIQSQLFLSQTAQTTLETMSRQIRYGYNYTGSTLGNYEGSEAGMTILADTANVSAVSGSAGSLSQILVNAENSPFILFESQNGDPTQFSDQNAFCYKDGKLYKISFFQVQTNGTTYFARCTNGANMFPDNITLEKISFDIYAGSSQNPRNPMVRIKMKISHPDAGTMDIQTTVTQRLVTYF